MSKANIVAVVKKPIFRHLFGKKRVAADKGVILRFCKKVDDRYKFSGGLAGWVYLSKKELTENLKIDDKDLFVLMLIS